MRKAVSGLRAWLVQRVSAVCMLLFIVFVLVHFFFDPPHSYQAWRDWVMSPAVSIATLVFLAPCCCMPGWVSGMWSWTTNAS